MPLHLPRLHSYHGPFKHLHHSDKKDDKKGDKSAKASGDQPARKRAETDARPSGDVIRESSEYPQVQDLSISNSTSSAATADDNADDNDAKETFHTPLNSPLAEPGDHPTLDQQLAAQSNGPRKTPFEHPLATCKPNERPGLTTEQAAKYATVHKDVAEWLEKPPNGSNGKPIDPLTEGEQMWLTRECLLRYLRASSWNTSHAVKRLLDTLTWRREFGATQITAESVSKEAETGKMVILGYDNNARPCLYMNPGRQNTEKSQDQIRHLVYLLERVIDMMDAGQETTALLINFKGATTGGSPSVGQGKQVLNILQGHYPERLGRACISDLPWYINTFFKLISPFIDPVTREKMIFNDDLRKHIPPEQLDKEFGGDCDFTYDHDAYWMTLDRMCTDRRAAYKQRWVDAGRQLGEYESYLRGGDQAPLRDCKSGTDEAIPVDSTDGGSQPRPVGE